MQRATILVLSLFAVVTIGVNGDVAEKLSKVFLLPRSDVETCANKTNIENVENLGELPMNTGHTPEINESLTKVGCLFACLAQKKEVMSGARLNEDKIKELADSKLQHPLSGEALVQRNRIINTCVERGNSKSNECEVAITYFLCLVELGQISASN